MDNQTGPPQLSLKLILQWMGVKFLIGIAVVLFLVMFILSQGLGAMVQTSPPPRWNEALAVGYDTNHHNDSRIMSKVGYHRLL